MAGPRFWKSIRSLFPDCLLAVVGKAVLMQLKERSWCLLLNVGADVDVGGFETVVA